MFGLMTVARHNAVLVAALKEMQEVEARIWRARIDAMGRDTDGWRLLATKLAADVVDLRKREAPPIPGPEEAAVGSVDVGDAEWVPSAIAKREKVTK